MKNGLSISADGSKYWYRHGKYHRVDGPAQEWANGSKLWFLNGLLHRVDGPAKEWASGTKIWYLNGKKHREDGPACEFEDGDKYWCRDDKFHRVDGPAIESADGTKKWYVNGKELIPPDTFSTIETWFLYLNENESDSYQTIHDINGIIEIIKNPSGKQIRVHQMRWVL